MSDPLFELDGQVVVVTGAGQGNGAAIAAGLARAGARVMVADIAEAAARSVADRIRTAGGAARAATLDVRDPASAARLALAVRDAFGPADVLVNNAGIIRRVAVDAPADGPTGYEAAWREIFAVNVDGAMHMTRALLSQLRETRGRIVNVGSIMSLAAGPGLSAYAASKGALAQLTKALAQDLAPHGIRVNAILPGVIETPMTAATRADPDAIGRFMAHTPMHRCGRPDELVGPVAFLASDASSYVTGALLPVDGGYLTA